MATNFYTAGFGPKYGSLSTVGVTVYNANNTVAVARQTASELKAGTGDYGHSVNLPDTFSGFLEWDSGTVPNVYLHENINLGATGITIADVANTLTAQGFTTGRAAKLDHLDADVSSRSTLTAGDVWANLTRTLTDSGTDYILGGIERSLDSRGLTGETIARLDVNVSSRNATAPDNAGIAAIRERTGHLPDAPAAKGDTMKVDLTQAIPTNNDENTIGEALQGARAQAFGTWKVIGSELHIYAADNVTILKSFTLDNPQNPTRRIG